MDAKRLGEKIYNLRKAREWTQAQLAEKLFVSDKTVSRWESGIGYPEISQLPQIASLFGVSTDYLLNAEMDNIKTENETNQTISKTVTKEEKKLNNNAIKINKKINITFIILMSIMLISLFIPMEYGFTTFFGSGSVTISMIDLLGSTQFKEIFIILIFLLFTIYEIISNIIVLSNENIEQKGFARAYKITSLVSGFMLTLASGILVQEVQSAYTIILLLTSIIIATLAVIHLFIHYDENDYIDKKIKSIKPIFKNYSKPLFYGVLVSTAICTIFFVSIVLITNASYSNSYNIFEYLLFFGTIAINIASLIFLFKSRQHSKLLKKAILLLSSLLVINAIYLVMVIVSIMTVVLYEEIIMGILFLINAVLIILLLIQHKKNITK